MCAIFGIVGKSDLNLIKEISRTQIFRGPDKQDFYSDANLISIGNNRLAVIDVENGSQPMLSEDGRYVIVYNGCIYNFKEIKEYLISKNINFKTDCDTEVIVNSFMYFGTKCFNYFDGMWAIAIYDIKEKKCYLSRDYIGQKPLYYTVNKNYLLFSSQLKGILVDKKIKKRIKELSLKKYFSYSHIPAPLTIYEDIYQLEPGSFLEIDVKTLNIKKKIYWNILDGADNNLFFKNINENLFLNQFDNIIENHCISDNSPVLTLSGGVDSQLIFKSLSKKSNISTFTIGYENKSFDESRFVDEITNIQNKNIYVLDKEKIIEYFKDFTKKITDPIGDSSILPSYILFNQIKKISNVSIGGDGGDESFFGYITFDAFYIADKIKKIIPNFLNNIFIKITDFKIDNEDYITNKFKIKKFFQPLNYENKYFLPLWMSCLNLKKLNELFYNDFKLNEVFSETETIFSSNIELMRQAQYYYYKLYLPMVLNKIDQASMYNSVENRSPFLSKNIINFSLNLEVNKLYSIFNKKKFIKEKYSKTLDKRIFNQPKHGFALHKDLIINDKELIQSNIDESFLENKNFFYSAYNEYLLGNKEYGSYIWNELMINNLRQNH
tara:strand:- start:3899 stop:5722 length:1824 start_codon:yes stop_codon:yes gene_type:complete